MRDGDELEIRHVDRQKNKLSSTEPDAESFCCCLTRLHAANSAARARRARGRAFDGSANDGLFRRPAAGPRKGDGGLVRRGGGEGTYRAADQNEAVHHVQHVDVPLLLQGERGDHVDGQLYTVVELDEEDNGMAIKAELAGITGQTSVPQVFIGGEFIGGCNDGGIGGVMPLKSTGELEQRLIKAGALVPGARI